MSWLSSHEAAGFSSVIGIKIYSFYLISRFIHTDTETAKNGTELKEHAKKA